VKFITIHGHFYQPPRENPWLEAVEVQDSAQPYHDWNERIAAECYAANAAARRVGADDRILGVVNNYEKISFNVGPTLMAWLETYQPDVYEKILDADRRSRAAGNGHGNAIAQVYSHVIMPLASRRDKVTQVRWGIEDFRHRFGRDPEGMWLAETAVDRETLTVLAEAGLRFTILAPHQARRIRPRAGGSWETVGESIDPSRAYLWRSRRGHELAVFFYDAPISRAIAFQGALARGEVLVDQLTRGFSDARTWPQLVHCATDGESYGHHSKFGDMALAAALEQIERGQIATLTNYGAFLAAHSPSHEVEVRENSSWSCAHGVERWRADCGCRSRGDWHQRWRAPLRAALDWLAGETDTFFEARAGVLLKDPWEARDDYIRVILDRGRRGEFLERHRATLLDHRGQVEALRLLELQRFRILMFTSCGWFFDDISGLEPVQLLKYAAMVVQYIHDLGGSDLTPQLTRRLAAAPSNVADLGDGREVYRRQVRSSIVDLRRVIAHYAISSLFENYGDETQIYAYSVRRLDEVRDAYGGTAFAAGHVRVESKITGDTEEAAYAVLHHGGHDFHCGVRQYADSSAYEEMKAALARCYARHSMSEMIRALDTHFPGEPYSLRHLFLEERRRILARVTEDVLDRNETAYRRIWQENRKLVHYLRDVDAPVPEMLSLVGRHVIAREIAVELARVESEGAVPDRVFELMGEATALGFAPDLTPAGAPMRRAVAAAMDALAQECSPERVAAAASLIENAQRLGLGFDEWQTQTRFVDLWRARPDVHALLAPLGERLGFSLER
jgi:alpha-amylase/alpha-mannosidase (GH57 family)